MRKRTLVAGLCAVAAGLAVMPAVAVAQVADPVVEVPVSFEVQNTNRTPVLCASDGETYTVRGTIVAPQSVLESADATTLYLHAVTWGDYYFNFKGVENYDFATQLAERGHVSVIVDRLGYGDSDKPPGNATCFGSEADVASQMVDQLRSGEYAAEGREAPAFEDVYLGGSSVGGLTANITAYSFGNVDGVINMSWGDFAATPFTGRETADVVLRCLAGGDEGAPPNYAAFFKNSRERFYFNSAEQEVRDAVPPLNPDPCGQLTSIPAAIGADVANLARIDVPVLVSFGTADAVFGPQPFAAQQQAARYLGSPEVTTSTIPDASHYPLVEANHLQLVDDVDRWLQDRAAD